MLGWKFGTKSAMVDVQRPPCSTGGCDELNFDLRRSPCVGCVFDSFLFYLYLCCCCFFCWVFLLLIITFFLRWCGFFFWFSYVYLPVLSVYLLVLFFLLCNRRSPRRSLMRTCAWRPLPRTSRPRTRATTQRWPLGYVRIFCLSVLLKRSMSMPAAVWHHVPCDGSYRDGYCYPREDVVTRPKKGRNIVF